MSKECFECDAPAYHAHHVVPKSLGGKRIVALCLACHGLVHDRSMCTAALTKGALARKKLRGERVGSVPYGYKLGRDGKTLKPNESEMRVIRYAKRLRRAGLSFRSILWNVQREYNPIRKNKKWHLTVIVRMIAIEL